MGRIIISLFWFFVAAIFEIGGGYIIWLWLKEKRTKCLLGIYAACWLCCIMFGGAVLFLYGVIPTLQPENFGRVFAAYGGIFIVSSILWGSVIDKKKPDRYEILGALIALVGAGIIMYAPRL